MVYLILKLILPKNMFKLYINSELNTKLFFIHLPQYNFVTPVILTSKHRLGFFIPASVNKSLPVPFGVDSSLAFLSESVDTFTAFSQLSPGATIRLKTQTFSRSFAKSIFFCRNQSWFCFFSYLSFLF